MIRNNRTAMFLLSLSAAVLACNLPGGAPASQPQVEPPQASQPAGDVPAETLPPNVVHIQSPATTLGFGTYIYDVESSGTAAERRAPYGDSYNINRLERPFLQDMTYVRDLDIVKAVVSEDADWFYVSIDLVGTDPNNVLGIDYGLELDKDYDGFADDLIWAVPPYTSSWDTANVKIFEDKNHDTSAVSPVKSDAPITTDGYDTQTYFGGPGDADPDLAWVRLGGGAESTLQFAFKKSWSGTVFMLGVVADANFRDAHKFDLVDRFTEAEAGSPVKEKQYYPLKALFAVDNTCREAFGFKPTGYEPQLCPREEATPAPKTPEPGCTDPGQYHDEGSCEAAGCAWRQNGSVVVAVVYYCTYP